MPVLARRQCSGRLPWSGGMVMEWSWNGRPFIFTPLTKVIYTRFWHIGLGTHAEAKREKKSHSNLKFWKSKRKKVENFDQTFDEKVKQAKQPVHQPSAHKMSKIVCNQIYIETFVWHIETTFMLKTRHPWQYPADVIMEYSNLLQITLNYSASRLCNTDCTRQC